jgi:ribosomal protein L32E
MFATDWVIMKSLCLLYDSGFMFPNSFRFRRVMYEFWRRNNDSKVTRRNFTGIIKELNKNFTVEKAIDIFGIDGMAYGTYILKFEELNENP